MAGTASLAIVACSENLLRLARRRNLRGRGVLVLTPPTKLIDERINMTEHIQVYAKMVNVDAEMGVSNVGLSGIDASQVLNEFSVEERLESLELSDIADYLTKKENEAIEERAEERFSQFLGEDVMGSLDKLTIRRISHE